MMIGRLTKHVLAMRIGSPVYPDESPFACVGVGVCEVETMKRKKRDYSLHQTPFPCIRLPFPTTSGESLYPTISSLSSHLDIIKRLFYFLCSQPP